MENNKSEFGTITGIIIVIIVLLIGGYYFINQRIEKSKEFQNTINQNGVVSTSTELSDLESEVNSTNFDNLGSGIDQL